MNASTAELRRDLVASRDTLMDVVAKLTAEDWERPAANPEWTARDTLAHLVASEESMLARIVKGLAGDGKLRPDFDLHLWNRRQVEKRRDKSPADLLVDLSTSRTELLRLLEDITGEQLAVPVEHPANRDGTVQFIFNRIAEHEREHARDLAASAGGG